MKRSLVAVAVASAFAAPAAFAEVSITGALNIGIAFIDSDNGRDPTTLLEVPDSGQGRTSLATNYSNLNVSSSDDIGNGNRVVANIQFDLGLAGTGAFANRNSFLGMEGGWGSLKMGTNENVYERWMYESDPIDGAMGIGGNIQMLGQTGFGGAAGGHDWFVKGNGENSCGASGTGGNCETGSFWRRTHHTVWYNSPVIARGFTFEIDQTMSAFKDATSDPTVTSIGAQFKPEGARWFANVGYEMHKDSDLTIVLPTTATSVTFTGLADATGIQFGGGFTLGSLLLTARYEMLEWEASAAAFTLERTHMWLGAKWSLPGGYIGAEVGMAEEAETNLGDIADSGATMIGLAYFHNLSKQSQLYVAGTMISNDDNAAYAIDAGSGSTGGLGSDHTAFTVGIKHVF